MKEVFSTSHDLVKHWVRLQKERSYRHEVGRVLVEGKNALRDLLVRHRPVRLMVTERQLPYFDELCDECIVISEAVAQKISDLESPEGCCAEFALPQPPKQPVLEKVVILDRLQDPGNVGTLLRTCLAFGVQTVICIEPSCDPWNPKVIRAAKGAQFDLSLLLCSWDRLPQLGPLLVADAAGVDVRTVPRLDRWALVLGNEAHGAEIPLYVPKTVLSITMSGPMESLNVAQAGAILLYVLLQ